MFQSAPGHAERNYTEEVTPLTCSMIPLKGEVSNRSLFLMRPMFHGQRKSWFRAWPMLAVAAILAWASSGPAPMWATWLPQAFRWAAGVFLVAGLVVTWVGRNGRR